MTLADEIEKMILSALESMEVTSASPGHINHLIQVNNIDKPDLEPFLTQNDKKEFRKEIGEASFISNEQKNNVKQQFQQLSKEDVQGMLDKVGLRPDNISGLLQLVGGKGAIGSISRVAGLAVPLTGPVATSLMIEPVTKAVIAELQRPGGFMDKRVKIDAQKEFFAALDRQTRQNTRIGDRQVIIQQFDGFRNFEGFASTNTSRTIRDNADRVLDIGLFDRAQGVQ